MLYALSFLFLFTIGGLTGLFLGTLAVDVHLHDTYFVVAHFHYVMMGGTVIAFLGGLHHWWPKMIGTDVQRAAGVAIACGAHLHRLQRDLLHASSSSARHGMPRRYTTTSPQFQPLHAVSTVGSLILGRRLLHHARSTSSTRWCGGAIAAANPWGGKSLEWQPRRRRRRCTTSTTIPVVTARALRVRRDRARAARRPRRSRRAP